MLVSVTARPVFSGASRPLAAYRHARFVWCSFASYVIRYSAAAVTTTFISVCVVASARLLICIVVTRVVATVAAAVVVVSVVSSREASHGDDKAARRRRRRWPVQSQTRTIQRTGENVRRFLRLRDTQTGARQQQVCRLSQPTNSARHRYLHWRVNV